LQIWLVIAIPALMAAIMALIHLWRYEWHLAYQFEPMQGKVYVDNYSFRTPWIPRLILQSFNRDPVTNWRWRWFFALPTWMPGEKLRAFASTQCVVLALVVRWSVKQPEARNRIVGRWSPRGIEPDHKMWDWQRRMNIVKQSDMPVDQLIQSHHQLLQQVARNGGYCTCLECPNKVVKGQVHCEPHRRQIEQFNRQMQAASF
jgi:hypothetical protein